MKNTILFLFLLLRIATYSQPGLVWAKQIGGINTDFGFSMIVDKEGSVYVTGQVGFKHAEFPT